MGDGAHWSREELLAEWLHTWPRHHGDVSVGAPIFGYTPESLERRFLRMRRDGMDVPFSMNGGKA